MNLLLAWTLLTSPGLADSLWSLNARGEFETVLQIARARNLKETPDRDLWLAVAFAYRNLDSLDQARHLYEAILEANPQDTDALLGLALVLSWQDRLDSAIQTYRKALELQPGNLEALLGLARTCGWASRWACAQEALERARRLNPENPEVEELAGDLALWQDRLKEATQAYRRAFFLDSTRIRAGLQWARSLEWQGKYRLALRAYRRVLQVDPNNPEALKGVASCRDHLALQARLTWKSVWEDDNGTQGRYHAPILELHGPDLPFWQWSLKTTWLLNRRDTLQNRLVQWIPGIVILPQGPVTLRAAYAWSPAPAARNWWLGASARLRRLHLGLAWRNELLEPVREIQARTLRAEARLQWGRWDLKTFGEWGTVPADTNRSRVLELDARVFLIHRHHTRLALGYTYGTMGYDHWSALYYSPEAIRRHSLGLSVFHTFSWGYAYAEGSGSVWTAKDTPGVQTFAAEIGFGRFFASLSYFATTENYHTWTLETGIRWPLRRPG